MAGNSVARENPARDLFRRLGDPIAVNCRN
jgi:hypothetical protein